MLMKKILNEGNEIHNFISSSGSGTVINYGSGSDFLTSNGSGSGSGSTRQKVTVPAVPVPVPQHWPHIQSKSASTWIAMLTSWRGQESLWNGVLYHNKLAAYTVQSISTWIAMLTS
jgi:hypothetical protein